LVSNQSVYALMAATTHPDLIQVGMMWKRNFTKLTVRNNGCMGHLPGRNEVAAL
jgi:hypothetical protein